MTGDIPSRDDPAWIERAASLLHGPIPADTIEKVLNAVWDQPDWEKHQFYPVPRGTFPELERFRDRPWNNIGHRAGNPPGGNHTKPLERRVLEWAADLFFGLHGDSDWWGCLTNGGTGGNRAGLLAARDALDPAGSPGPRAVCYYSSSDHYSIPKLLHELRIPAVVVRAQPDGEMDYQDLYERLDPAVPAIVNLTAGTTTTEAITDPQKVAAALDRAGVPRTRRHLHCDGALSAIYARLDGQLDTGPIDTLAVSGHKFFGVDRPTGFTVGRRLDNRREQHIAYINTIDDSPAGSIDGYPAAAMWLAVARGGSAALLERAHQDQAVAQYLTDALTAIGVPAWRWPHAITVVFPEPPASILQNWPIYRDHDGQCHAVCLGLSAENWDPFITAWARTLTTTALPRPRPSTHDYDPASLGVVPQHH